MASSSSWEKGGGAKKRRQGKGHLERKSQKREADYEAQHLEPEKMYDLAGKYPAVLSPLNLMDCRFAVRFAGRFPGSFAGRVPGRFPYGFMKGFLEGFVGASWEVPQGSPGALLGVSWGSSAALLQPCQLKTPWRSIAAPSL